MTLLSAPQYLIQIVSYGNWFLTITQTFIDRPTVSWLLIDGICFCWSHQCIVNLFLNNRFITHDSAKNSSIWESWLLRKVLSACPLPFCTEIDLIVRLCIPCKCIYSATTITKIRVWIYHSSLLLFRHK